MGELATSTGWMCTTARRNGQINMSVLLSSQIGEPARELRVILASVQMRPRVENSPSCCSLEAAQQLLPTHGTISKKQDLLLSPQELLSQLPLLYSSSETICYVNFNFNFK